MKIVTEIITSIKFRIKFSIIFISGYKKLVTISIAKNIFNILDFWINTPKNFLL